MFRNFGEPAGASTGSVSYIELTRTTPSVRRSSSVARRRFRARSPRFEPSAMRTDSGGAVDADVIRQLVDILGGAREVSSELFACAADGLDDTFRILAGLETDRELRGDVVPE